MRLGFLGVLFASILLLPPPASARTVVVSPGPGAFQAGFDALLSGHDTQSGSLDTLLVQPGFYDEAVLLRVDIDVFSVLCPAGPAVTRVRSIRFQSVRRMADAIRIRGLGVLERVDMGDLASFATWRDCVFEGGFSARAESGERAGALARCELHGRVFLTGFMGGAFEDLRFIAATLYVRNAPAEVGFRRCTFTGPVDTAVVALPSVIGGLSFADCTFTGCGFALVLGPKEYVETSLGVARCRFEDIAQAAICATEDRGRANDYPLGVFVGDCRFERCGAAVLLTSPVVHSLGFDRDTVIDCRGPAVLANVGYCSMSGSLFRGGGGDAARLRILPGPGRWSAARTIGPVTLVGNRFEANRGSGVVLRDTVDQQPAYRQGILIAANTFARNDGAGAILAVHHANIRDNLAARNGGAGLAVEILDPPLFPSAIERNTCALDAGDGLAVAGDGPAEGVPVNVRNNLVAGNLGTGLAVGTVVDTVEHNDSWLNTGGAYAGVPPGFVNLALDPGFCDPARDDFHVQTASPCAPTGPFGQIGALGVGCEASRVALAARERRQPAPGGSGVPVDLAILGGRLFDANTVDLANVRVNGAPLPGRDHGVFAPALRDMNGDGLTDLDFALPARALTGGDGAVAFDARTTAGLLLAGSTTLVTRPRGASPLAQAGAGVPLGVRAPAAIAGRIALDVTLPARDAALELFDVTGRRLWTRALDGFAPGAHRLEVPVIVPPGLYFARVARPGESAVARVVVLR